MKGRSPLRLDPVEMFEFRKREISPRVPLLHDYPRWEWTIVVRTEDVPGRAAAAGGEADG